MPATDDPAPPELNLPLILETLRRHSVDVLIVGGVAAWGYGAQRVTADLDCLVRCEETNLERLAAAMRELGARLRVEGLSDEEAKTLPVPLDGRWLRDREVSTWRTDAGDFDVLTDIPARDGQRLAYEDLAARATIVETHGFAITAASIEDIIASKEWANRPKDRDALEELRRLARSGGRGTAGPGGWPA